jgi:TIR domain
LERDTRTDFFISYTSADRSWAEWIAWQLEQENYTTIIQAWDIQAGSNFVLEMDKAARTAERTIAVLSPDYFTSHFTPSEWAAAFRRDPKGEHRFLVPVRVRECDGSDTTLVINSSILSSNNFMGGSLLICLIRPTFFSRFSSKDEEKRMSIQEWKPLNSFY